MKPFFVFLGLWLLAWPVIPAQGIETGAAAPPFRLESGDRQILSLDQIRGRVVLVLYEAKEEVELNRALKNEIRVLYADSPLLKTLSVVVPVINASSAYWPVTKIWQKNLRENSEKEGLVIYGDWNGKMYSDYGMKGDTSNVLVIDKNGIIRYVRSGRLAPDDIRRLTTMLKDLAEQ